MVCWVQRIKIRREKGCIQIPLDWSDPTGARMPALGERLFLVGAALMTILGQFRVVGRDFAQGAASFCNYAFQMRIKQPWCSKTNRLPKHLLPPSKRRFFNSYRMAHTDEIIDEPAMQAFALSCELALGIGKRTPGRYILPTVLPDESSFFHTAFLVVVLWVIRPTLPIHLSLQSAFFSCALPQFLTKRYQLSLSGFGHNGQTGWTNV